MPCGMLPPGCHPSFNDDDTREQAMTGDSTSEAAQADVRREGQAGGDGNDETAREPQSSKIRMMNDSDPLSLPFYNNSNMESSCRAVLLHRRIYIAMMLFPHPASKAALLCY